jgi:hypothetical protein
MAHQEDIAAAAKGSDEVGARQGLGRCIGRGQAGEQRPMRKARRTVGMSNLRLCAQLTVPFGETKEAGVSDAPRLPRPWVEARIILVSLALAG